jgi:hypothetical protein
MESNQVQNDKDIIDYYSLLESMTEYELRTIQKEIAQDLTYIAALLRHKAQDANEN